MTPVPPGLYESLVTEARAARLTELPEDRRAHTGDVRNAGWIVRHVLRYGRDARVVEPEWVAEEVREAVRKVSEQRQPHPAGDA